MKKLNLKKVFLGSVIACALCVGLSFASFQASGVQGQNGYPVGLLQGLNHPDDGRKNFDETWRVSMAEVDHLELSSVSSEIQIVRIQGPEIQIRFVGMAYLHQDGSAEVPWRRTHNGREAKLEFDRRAKERAFSIQWNFPSTEGKVTLSIPEGWKGELTLDSVSGKLVGEWPKLLRVKASTVSGDLKLVGDTEQFRGSSVSGELDWSGEVRELEIETTSGDLKLRLKSAAEKAAIETVSGEVELEVPASYRPNYTAESVSGEFRNEAGWAMQSVDRQKWSGEGRARQQLKIETTSGDIRVTSAQP
jgi:hypothetical protein